MFPTGRLRTNRRLCGAVLVLLLAGCGLVEPDLPFRLPEEDPSIDPQATVEGPFAYPCKQWLGGARPPGDYLLVDIFFVVNGGIEAEGPVDVDRPVLAHRRHVERAGGVILRSYHLAGMRAWFPIDSIPEIEKAPRYAVVRRVSNSRRYDTTVYVEFKTTDHWAADSALIVSLGGRVLIPMQLPGPANTFLAFPNRSLPFLRADPNVAKVIYDGVPGCF